MVKYFKDHRSPLCPRNPYAAKTADALVISYAHTFNMWTCNKN